MNSGVLKMASGVLKPLFLIVSIWLLLRGHNYPGGGFIGGLIAGNALIFKPLAYDQVMATRKEKQPFLGFLSLGIMIIFISAISGFAVNDAILEGQWIKMELAFLPQILKLGTPLLFDVGVYFIVIGFIHLVFHLLMEEWLWK